MFRNRLRGPNLPAEGAAGARAKGPLPLRGGCRAAQPPLRTPCGPGVGGQTPRVQPAAGRTATTTRKETAIPDDKWSEEDAETLADVAKKDKELAADLLTGTDDE